MELQPKRNIEIKARCKDLNAARARAESLGAKFAGTLDQVDTYFHVPNGRLKVRQIYNEHTELIFYSRENITEPRPCDYHVITITEWDKSVIAVLSKAMGVRGIVRKRRELLLWHNVRIHLDEVEKLGTFIELEAVVCDVDDEAISRARIDQLSHALQIQESIAVSYSDLLGFS